MQQYFANYFFLKLKPSLLKYMSSYTKTSLETQLCLKTKLSLKYLTHSISLEVLNQAKNIPLVLTNYLVKILGNSVKGFLSYDRTY